jgi:hypothetical protein
MLLDLQIGVLRHSYAGRVPPERSDKNLRWIARISFCLCGIRTTGLYPELLRAIFITSSRPESANRSPASHISREALVSEQVILSERQAECW